MEVGKRGYLALPRGFISGFTAGRLAAGLALRKGRRARGAWGDQRDNNAAAQSESAGQKPVAGQSWLSAVSKTRVRGPPTAVAWKSRGGRGSSFCRGVMLAAAPRRGAVLVPAPWALCELQRLRAFDTSVVVLNAVPVLNNCNELQEPPQHWPVFNVVQHFPLLFHLIPPRGESGVSF